MNIRKRLVLALVLAGIIGLMAIGCGPAPGKGVVLPPPQDKYQYQYSISELCHHLQAEGYDIKGTLRQTMDDKDLSGVVARIPALARRPVIDYLRDGIEVTFEIRMLCKTVNR